MPVWLWIWSTLTIFLCLYGIVELVRVHATLVHAGRIHILPSWWIQQGIIAGNASLFLTTLIAYL